MYLEHTFGLKTFTEQFCYSPIVSFIIS